MDVNVLIAMAWPSHRVHEKVLEWLAHHAREGWATCPLTQSSFVRILSNPTFSANALTPRRMRSPYYKPTSDNLMGNGRGLTAADMTKCVWTQPEVVAQIEFLEWTESDHLRHSKFAGLREDKNARSVSKEPASEKV